MANTVPVSHCTDCVMQYCSGCFTVDCQCDPCIIFATWLAMDDNAETTLHKRPFTEADKQRVLARKWINREVWLLTQGKEATEEGCPTNPFIQGQWAERERIGMLLVSKLCNDGRNCVDENCKVIMDICKELD